MIENIGPPEAGIYLETMGSPSYPVDPEYVTALATRMSRGEWTLEGPPIETTRVGKMIHGRRRMHAIIEANARIDFKIVYLVPKFEKLPDPDDCPSCKDGTHPVGTHLSERDYAETLRY